MKTYEYQGRQVEGEEVDFKSEGEQWNLYRLEDGSTLKLKTVLLSVVRLSEYNETGDPVYQFSAQQIVTVQAPDYLKKANK